MAHTAAVSLSPPDNTSQSSVAEASPSKEICNDYVSASSSLQSALGYAVEGSLASREGVCEVSGPSSPAAGDGATASDLDYVSGPDTGASVDISIDNRPRSTFDSAVLDEEGDEVLKELGIDKTKTKKKLKDFFAREVKVQRHEKNQVQNEFKSFQKEVNKALEENTNWKWELYNCGSTYDGTKVTRLDEIDCLLCPKWLRLPSGFLEVVLEEAPPPFCFLKLSSAQSRKAIEMREQLSDLLTDEGFISSNKYKEKMFNILERAVKDIRKAKVDETKYDFKSASYPVLYEAIPKSDGTGLDTVAIDLVPAIHIDNWQTNFSKNLSHMQIHIDGIKKEGFDLVTKECEKEGFETKKDLLWRLSFSRAEKFITKHADGTLRHCKAPGSTEKAPDTCRKPVLRMLKRFLELFKGFDNARGNAQDPVGLRKAADILRAKLLEGMTFSRLRFSTFQIKTLMWTEIYVTSPEDKQWLGKDMPARLHDVILAMKEMLCGRRVVCNFFLPDVDIMEDVPLEERRFYYVLFYVAEKIFIDMSHD